MRKCAYQRRVGNSDDPRFIVFNVCFALEMPRTESRCVLGAERRSFDGCNSVRDLAAALDETLTSADRQLVLTRDYDYDRDYCTQLAATHRRVCINMAKHFDVFLHTRFRVRCALQRCNLYVAPLHNKNMYRL